MSPLLFLDQAHERVVVSPRGELDIASCQPLATALTDACRFGLAVVVDLADVTFVDCSGLAPLLAVQEDLAAVRAVKERAHPHDGTAHRFVGLGRMRRQRHGLQ